MKTRYNTGWEYIEYLKQFPEMNDKQFIGFRTTKRKGFEVVGKDKDGRFWYINECSFDVNKIEDDTDAWKKISMKSFVFCDD